MGKKYADYMDEISANDLYKGLLAFGLFSNRMPPVFSSTSFFDYCVKNHPTFSNSDHDYIRYKTLRNINVPRQLGIPVPMAYEKMCSVLKSNWSDIQSHFHTYTDSQTHVISRIHIQKRKNKDGLFEMNYVDWRNAGSPKDDLLIGKRFVVKADISTFFPSIYTHSIPWALVGKAVAKQNRSKSKWFNKIDKKCQEIKYGETHGLLIGPHASNLISEVILTVVDQKLYDKGWKFVRNIDDYTCYVETRARADSFIVDLGVALEEFDLQLNNKKTKIEELPDTVLEDWVRKLNGFSLLTSYGKVDYKQVRAYFDLAIELTKLSGGNASVLNYAIKVLSKQALTDNAKEYSWKMSMHLCILYPYLISIMDEYVFKAFDAPKDEIQKFIDLSYEDGLEKKNYEECSYAIYFALKYDMEVKSIDSVKVVATNDCIYKLLSFLYFRKKGDSSNTTCLQNEAKNLAQTDMDRNWIFIYETLDQQNLVGDWGVMKNQGISFLKSEFRY